jgi:hypothetical protein
MLRSAPPITRLSRLVAGEAAPKARVRGYFTGEAAGRIAASGEGSGRDRQARNVCPVFLCQVFFFT